MKRITQAVLLRAKILVSLAFMSKSSAVRKVRITDHNAATQEYEWASQHQPCMSVRWASQEILNVRRLNPGAKCAESCKVSEALGLVAVFLVWGVAARAS